jgi:hypothetical protein
MMASVAVIQRRKMKQRYVQGRYNMGMQAVPWMLIAESSEVCDSNSLPVAVSVHLMPHFSHYNLQVWPENYLSR